jgi:hypothetical protein
MAIRASIQSLIHEMVGTTPAVVKSEVSLGLASNAHVKVLIAPAVVCAAMVAIAAVTCTIARIEVAYLFYPYFSMSFAVTVSALLLSVFCWVLLMARDRADGPGRKVVARVRSRATLLLLPFAILPLFLVSYTAAKTAIPFLVGFGWDGFWTEADRFLFGDDVWRISQHWLGTKWMPIYAWFYTAVWGFAFMGVMTFVAINARPSLVAVFYTAMLLTWTIGGWLMALTFSSAGPIFTHLFDPILGNHFRGLHEAIAANLPADNSLRLTQAYLAESINSRVAVKGGGISAMPSMHLGAASIYIFAAKKTKWLIPAVLFWLIIFVLSGYVGYHYWVDGIAAAAIAWVCWKAAEVFVGDRRMGSGSLPDRANSPQATLPVPSSALS